MDYFNIVFDNICKGYVSPKGIKKFLDLVFNLVCDNGFNEQVVLLLNSMLKFERLLFEYNETKSHIMKEVIYLQGDNIC